MAVTLLQLRTGAQRLSDKVGDLSLDAPTWNEWINDGQESLWAYVSTFFADHFYATVDFALAGGVGGNSYDVSAIPAVNFRRTRLLERDPDTRQRRRVPGFNFNQKNDGAGARTSSVWDTGRRQKLMGKLLIVEPYELAGGSYRLYYVPKLAALVADTDVLDFAIEEYAEYMKVFAAMKALGQEESDTGPQTQRLAALRQEIAETAAQRDDGQGDVIADVEGDGDWRPW